MKYEELVKALRERALRENEWYEHGGDIIEDAASAIEALQEQVRMLDKHDTDLHNEGYDVGYYAGRRDWEPKRGEWVGVSPMVDTVQCSVCGGELFSAELETPYCPYCGAKMEVQDV